MKKFLYIIGASLIALGSCKGKSNSNHLVASKDPETGLYEGDTSYFRQLTPEELQKYHDSALAAAHRILGNNFNGQILVAKNGQIVFEEYDGIYNFQTKSPITPTTSLHIASISKTFTGMTVLHLWEEGRLSLDDTIQKFFPNFPYHGITIKMLLAHRSGLPNYLNFLDVDYNRRHKATNQEVIDYMVTHVPPLQANPDKHFHYCNTNFMMLASIIEKVTGMTFPKYMKDSVFTPLGMMHTHIFEPKDTVNYVMTYNGNRPYPMDHLDVTYGDKNVYSTVRDLLQWDRSLYEHSFIKATTLKMAYEPQSNERVSMHNYGLAWRMLFNKNGDSIIYHNGKWHGTNSVFTRLLQDTATIIVIGNRLDKRIYGAKAISSIFTGKPDYVIPVE
ncbi:serine hydrolase domain-containing protein [Rhizosphaericola mali]|uniref:Beta-lactamase family protein n=1 Tax=Rhizosphaericola mali TaxID=2545455 RepID=A0A5P2G121_9BACT|nr:serine hydrolase domain-containing protein [Rhizosphaericola mali]QES89506.1 beta-lactamase family protein [Rhizosphaericola mali]